MTSNKYFRLVAVLVAIFIVWYVGPILFLAVSPWRAVFLENGQVYFGKMLSIPFVPTVKLTSVYYINSNNGGGKDIVLSKLGDDIHGPKDELTISKHYILYYETLRRDSNLVKTIQNKEKN